MPEQHLRHAMAGVHQIPPARVMGPGHLAGRLDLGRRHHDCGQRAGQQQPREQLGVLAIGLNPIRRTARRLARRDHRHRDPRRDRGPVEPKPGRARLIARLDRSRQPSQPRHRPLDPRPETHPRQLSRQRVDRRPMRRPGVDIEPNPRHRGPHGRTSSQIWRQPEPNLRPDKPPRGASGHQLRQSTHRVDHPIGSSAVPDAVAHGRCRLSSNELQLSKARLALRPSTPSRRRRAGRT